MRQVIVISALILLAVSLALAQPPSRDEARRPVVTTDGMIQAADDQVLILRTDTGRYVTMSLPSQYSLVRRTDASLESVAAGAVVGVTWGEVEGGRLEALQLRVYPGAPDGALTRRPAADTRTAGLEFRGVVQRVERGTNGSVVRLTQADGESAVQLSQDTAVTIVAPASRAELQPFTGRARAVAQRQEDGTLVARAIEILR